MLPRCVRLVFELSLLSASTVAGGAALPSFFVASGVASFRLQSPALHAQFSAADVTFERQGEAIQLRFLGANSAAVVQGETALSARVNFLMGNDPRHWRTNLPAFGKLLYRDLYPGIDMTYALAADELKSEFTVWPGASPALICLHYSGAVEIGDAGDLIVHGENSTLYEHAPEIYQNTPSRRRAIRGRFLKLDENTVGFAVDPYDESLPLVIDPVLSYSTYLGGSGIGAVTSLALDAGGNLYATGWTEALDFPIAGAFQSSLKGGVDAFVVKFNPAGSALLYATYFGGSSDDRGAAIAVDSSGQAYVTGSTASYDFPTAQALRSSLGGQRNAFVLKLNSAGNAPVYSTYLGGTGYDLGTAIAADTSGNAYIAGDTQSVNFPLLNPAQSTIGGATDAFVTKLTATGALAFSTYLGGSASEHVGGIAIDSSGNTYIAGGTYSTNFPVSSAFQNTNGGSQDAFITKLSASGSQILYSTYLGGAGSGSPEQASDISVDSSGNAYVAGVTNSNNFPVTSGAFQTAYGGLQDAFLAKINPTGTALVFSTYLGGFDFDWANGVGLDASGNIYVAGYTASYNFAQVSPLQNALAGGYDAFVSRFTSAGNSLTFSTWFGGGGSDVANALVVDSSGNMFVGGQTNSVNLPLSGAIQSSNNGGSIGWVARMGVTAPPPQTPATVSVSPSSGSGNTVTFTAQYSDTGGAAALTSVALLLNTSAATSYACYATYNPSANNFSLFNDDPTTGSQTVVPGGGSQVNSQCQLNGAGSAASSSGNTLTVTYSFTFQPGFPGNKTVYTYALDAGANTGWVARATWTVTVPAPQPSATSVSPNSGLGAAGAFTFVFSDTQSANNLTGMIMLFATSARANNACYIVYDRNAGTVALAWDNGAGTDSRSLSASTTLQNSQCAVGAASAAAAGLSQIVTVNITFKGAFSGAQNIYMYATEGALNTGWVQRGTFTTAAGGVPVVGAMVPASGAGPGQRFSFTIADQGGASYLTGMAVLFAASFNNSNACLLSYDRTANKVSLAYDNPNSGAGTATPGSATIVSNSQCTLRAANSTVTIGATSIVVTFDVTFNAAWFGTKNVYAFAAEPGANSGWVTTGTWSVTGGAPTADSVSPSSGSGASPSFTFTVSDSSSQLNITGLAMLLTTGAPSNIASACNLFYNRANSTIGLYDDAGTTLGTKGVGSSATLQNSQCAVGYTGLSTSGNSVSLIVNLALMPAFSGAKTVYLQADEPATSSGWVARGSWTAP